MRFRKPSSIKKRLTSISSEMSSLRDEIRVLDEQLTQVVDETEDLRLRSIVSETPQAAKVHRDSAKWADSVRRDRESKVHRLSQLERKQDELLDQLTEQT